MPDNYVKHVNKMIISFIWGGRKSKLSKHVLYKSKENGGLNVPDLEKMIYVSNMKWMKKLVYGTQSNWTKFLCHFCKKSKLNVNVLIYANYDIEWLKKCNEIPLFYLNMFKEWLKLSTTKIPKNYFLWYNQNLSSKPLFYSEFWKSGIKYAHDLFYSTSHVIPFEHWVQRGVSKGSWLKWHGLIRKIESNPFFTNSIKQKEKYDTIENNFLIGDIDLMNCNPQDIYKHKMEICLQNTVTIPRIINYSNHFGDVSWSNIY